MTSTTNPTRHFTNLGLLVLGALLIALAGCAATGSFCSTSSSQAAEPAAQAPVQTGPDPDVVDLYGGDGMKIPVDGSSLVAFVASLDKIGRNTSESSFITLNNAIDYLLVYDLCVERSRENLAKKLDGKNGYEIIEKVRWMK